MRTSGVLVPLLALILLAGCDSYPRDIAGTRDSVVRSRQLHVGYGQMPAEQRARAQAFVDRVAAVTGAKVSLREAGSSEALFAALESGQVDLVMTEIARDSPWTTEVAVIDPIARRRLGERELGLSAIARNGENRWVIELEKHARDMQSAP